MITSCTYLQHINLAGIWLSKVLVFVLSGSSVIVGYTPLVAQVEVRCAVDSNRMLVGDQRTLTVDIQSESSVFIDSLIFERWNELGFTLLNPQSWQGDKSIHQQQFSFTVFDTGYIKLPPIPMVYHSNGIVDTAYSNDLVVEVNSIIVDSTGLAPIKPILKEPLKLRDYLPYILAFLAGCILIALFVIRKKKARLEETVIKIPDPPHEVALRDLAILKDKKLWQKGKIKSYQSELTHIIRAYIEKRFDTPALESTTGEILLALINKEIDEFQLSHLDQILNMADLIKFAKATPEVNIHSDFMDMAESFVLQTREIKKTGNQEEE